MLEICKVRFYSDLPFQNMQYMHSLTRFIAALSHSIPNETSQLNLSLNGQSFTLMQSDNTPAEQSFSDRQLLFAFVNFSNSSCFNIPQLCVFISVPQYCTLSITQCTQEQPGKKHFLKNILHFKCCRFLNYNISLSQESM